VVAASSLAVPQPEEGIGLCVILEHPAAPEIHVPARHPLPTVARGLRGRRRASDPFDLPPTRDPSTEGSAREGSVDCARDPLPPAGHHLSVVSRPRGMARSGRGESWIGIP
jgi:hypothetical protein